MKAIRITHVRAAERRSQASLAEAMGYKVYHDAAGHTFVVNETGENFSRDSKVLSIETIPVGWTEGAADPIGGWEAPAEETSAA